MRFFELLSIQHVAALIFIALIFILLFGVGLAYMATKKPTGDNSSSLIIQSFSDGITKANGPYPFIITLIITGTILWAFFYILFYGISEVKL